MHGVKWRVVLSSSCLCFERSWPCIGPQRPSTEEIMGFITPVIIGKQETKEMKSQQAERAPRKEFQKLSHVLLLKDGAWLVSKHPESKLRAKPTDGVNSCNS